MSNCPLPWFPIYGMETLGDADFQLWTPAERGCWFTLSVRCWVDGSIPEEIASLAKLCGCNAEEMLKHWSSIASKFKPHPIPGKLMSPRIEKEREEAIEKAEKIHGRAKAGAIARWSKEKRNMLEQCLSNAKPMLDDATSPSPSEVQKITPLPPKGGSLSPSAPGMKSKKVKLVDLGSYPPELVEAVSCWRALLKSLKDPDLVEKFRADQCFVAVGVGTNEKVWEAWQKRKSSTVKGVPVTDADILFAVREWSRVSLKNAQNGRKMVAKMLPSMINAPDFVDALVRAVDARNQAPSQQPLLEGVG